uniref:HD domain-containing protein n=1 Tax=Attheya septentrionalis TaxID=420275 RepID=A0A7S2UDT9_9STRA|mmetsp:Transcript_19061/g.34569  ORF Transcript_19061/g.34569 Transcript_19061/m.34569 type:complete len:246 (+) Transcript_19061:103-840(+)|eukprot:CAMPEP_0198302450 /NCGR_PEP_ID=MMETSP1449-20131203/55203_1 /TAXON_ID=420275 /ORGANISM="Attheya septentrionalis, Strain CCMP2084" /LENGTH=245 /DNA_ID=CAMNT_0044004795 /DNA_START=57 /DNA_END=797 /DNA_ORIENTATION=-
MDSLSFISDICGALKKIKRTGWKYRNVPLPESDADHMHRCAMCALLLSQPADARDDYSSENEKFHPSRVDQTRLLRMTVTHDLCESLAGDITPFCDPAVVASKYEKEKLAMEAIRKVVGDPLGEELFSLWKEYEDQDSVEALYCKDIDKFEMIVQAFEYEKEHLRQRSEVENISESPTPISPLQNSVPGSTPDVFSEPLRQFFVSTNKTMKSPLFRRLDKELRSRREEMLTKRGWDVTESERQKY